MGRRANGKARLRINSQKFVQAHRKKGHIWTGGWKKVTPSTGFGGSLQANRARHRGCLGAVGSTPKLGDE